MTAPHIVGGPGAPGVVQPRSASVRAAAMLAWATLVAAMGVVSFHSPDAVAALLLALIGVGGFAGVAWLRRRGHPATGLAQLAVLRQEAATTIWWAMCFPACSMVFGTGSLEVRPAHVLIGIGGSLIALAVWLVARHAMRTRDVRLPARNRWIADSGPERRWGQVCTAAMVVIAVGGIVAIRLVNPSSAVLGVGIAVGLGVVLALGLASFIVPNRIVAARERRSAP